MLQLKNKTPFATSMALFPNEAAIDTLYLIVKATFNIGPKWTLLDEQLTPQEEDIYWAEPGQSSIKYVSDFHTGKPATDIIMNGNAYAPSGRKVDQMDVHLAVGNVQKTVRVIGDRVWQQGRITAPQPFESMPMVYERAFGGSHIIEDEIQSAELRNLVGTGYAGKRKSEEMDGIALPNLEDPAHLIRDYQDQPEPACYGASAPNWQPRVSYAGTYDEAWQKSRAPYLPHDYDSRFLNMAHRDMIYPGVLQGGEPVQISGMHPSGNIQFKLPQVKFAAVVDIAGQEKRPVFQMETLTIEPNQLILSMVWKAALPCDKSAEKINEINISLSR